MGLLNALKLVDQIDVKAMQVDPDDLYPTGPISWGPNNYLDPGSGAHIDRGTALQVPALKRARDLIASTIAMAPFVEIDSNNNRKKARSFLAQPDASRPRPNIIASTVADLAFEGVSYWLITERYAEDGRPARAKHVPFDMISVETDQLGDVTKIYINGKPISQENIIGFESLSGGWLRAGAKTIRTAHKLEHAVRVFADKPLPLMVIKNMGPKLTEEQVDELLAYWDASEDRSVKYAGRDVEMTTAGWSPEQLGLNEARKHQTQEIARLTGVPAHYLSTDAGNSMTYTTTTQTRLDLYALALAPYAVAIESRLSMDDVTGRGTRVEFDFSAFLRADAEMRTRIYKELVPLGIMSVDEARAMEDLIPQGGNA